MYSLAISLGSEFSPSVGIENLFAIFSANLPSSRLWCDDVCPPNNPGCIVGVSNSSMSKARADILQIS